VQSIPEATRTDAGRRALARRGLAGARARILAAYLGVLVFVALLALVGLRHVLIARTTARADEDLREQVDRFVQSSLGAAPTLRGRSDLEAIFDAYVEGAGPDEDETFVLFVDGRHHPTRRAGALEHDQATRLRALARTMRRRGGQLDTGQGRFRYAIAPIRAGDGQLGSFAVILDFDTELADEVNAPLRLAGGVLVVLLLAGAALVAFVAGRALAPVRAVSEAARSINESDLTRRIPVRGDDAGSELARTFNAMLDRLEAAFASQHAFVSDAEHELRTPLTIIRGHLEVVSADPRESRQTIDLVLDEVERMTRLVGDLLVLARAEQPDFLQPEQLDLEAFAHELHAKATGLAPREWRLVQATPGILRGDRQRLTQAVMNLAENAVHHTQEDEIIELGSALRNGSAHIWVRDGGPGIEPGDEQRIFERFARGSGVPPGGSDGTGLGLAIVRAIAEAHGGGVRVRSVPGLGATFEIVLPIEHPAEAAAR
jgi:signal transduction histidine kinase